MLDLTLVVRFHKPTIEQRTYWSAIHNKLKDIMNVNYVVDGTEVDLLDIEEKYIYRSKINLGRFDIVVWHVKNNNVPTNYFKVFDCDDYISFTELEKFVKNFKKIKRNDLLISQNIYRYLGPRLSVEDVEKHKHNGGFESRLFQTYKTIIPTAYFDLTTEANKILIDKTSDFTFGEDSLRGIIPLNNGAKIIEMDNNFTLYHAEVGVTKANNIVEEVIGNHRSALIHQLVVTPLSKECIIFIIRTALKWNYVKMMNYFKNEKLPKEVIQSQIETNKIKNEIKFGFSEKL